MEFGLVSNRRHRWFSTLKSEPGEGFEFHGETKEKLFDDIEVIYDQRRSHSAIGYVLRKQITPTPSSFPRNSRPFNWRALMNLEQWASPWELEQEPCGSLLYILATDSEVRRSVRPLLSVRQVANLRGSAGRRSTRSASRGSCLTSGS